MATIQPPDKASTTVINEKIGFFGWLDRGERSMGLFLLTLVLLLLAPLIFWINRWSDVQEARAHTVQVQVEECSTIENEPLRALCIARVEE